MSKCNAKAAPRSPEERQKRIGELKIELMEIAIEELSDESRAVVEQGVERVEAVMADIPDAAKLFVLQVVSTKVIG